MGHKTGILVVLSAFLLVGALASITVAFAYADSNNDSNPLHMVMEVLQDFKYGQVFGDGTSAAAGDEISAKLINQLQGEVEELTARINSLENPAKIYTTELTPITNIDCSNRNMAKAFLSGWCPHPDRNIYFIEDSRVQHDSIIAINLLENYDVLEENSVCGVINQDSFNFSFHEPQTGEITILEDLHGFVMKCDQSPLSSEAVLKYTVINS